LLKSGHDNLLLASVGSAQADNCLPAVNMSDWTQNIHCYLSSRDLSLLILEVFILTGIVLFFMMGCQNIGGIFYLQTLLQLFIPNVVPGTILFVTVWLNVENFTRLLHTG
jgi:hypothetical protein